MVRAVLLAATVGMWVLAAVAGVAIAKADGYCTTSRMSGMTITLCRYSDPWQPSTTITCYDNRDYCTTREGN